MKYREEKGGSLTTTGACGFSQERRKGSSGNAAETLSLWFKRKRRRVQSRRCTRFAEVRRQRRRGRRRTVCRRVQFLEPLFTNRITAMHRD